MKFLISHHYLRNEFLLSVRDWIHTIWGKIIDIPCLNIRLARRLSTLLVALGILRNLSILRLLCRGQLLHTLIDLG